MKIVSALSGEEIADTSDRFGDAKKAVSETLGLHPRFLRVVAMQCSILVLSGKLLCERCSERVACSCRAVEDRLCVCEVLEGEDDAGIDALCKACREAEGHMADAVNRSLSRNQRLIELERVRES